MTDVFEPKNIPLMAASSLALSKQLLADKEHIFQVTLADGVINIPAKWLIVNLFTWRPLIRRNMTVAMRHTMCDGLVTSRRLATIQTAIYDDVVNANTTQNGVVLPDIDRAILEDLCETINDLHTMIATQLGEYHLSMSAFELSDLLLHPDIEPLTRIDFSNEMRLGTEATEEKLAISGRAIVEKLKDRSIPSNILAPFLELGQLNDNQLSQVVMAIGYRTDASDTMVRLPITTSYMRGLQNITDYAIESLAAKKTIYYNKNAMPETQYSNRKQQILSSAIRLLYPGDCGSQLTIPFHVSQDNARNLLGKYVVNAGQTFFLSRQNIEKYIGSTVQLRSPLTCRYTDGICHICGGRLTYYIPPHTAIGIASTVEYMASVAQLVLSAKHFAVTKAIPYIVDEFLRDYMIVRNNDIYMHEKIDISRLKIGVQFADIQHIKELNVAENTEESAPINEQQFSSIHHVIFADTTSDTILTPEVPMVSNGTVPYFSSELLDHIRDHPKCVTILEDMVWISLKGFDHRNEPLMRYVMQSNSMLRFNERLSKFATSEVREYTSLPEVLAQFSEMVFTKVKDVNIFHLETVLKSYLITDDTNYNIPVVTDINNVKFGTLLSIIPRRSLGGLFAYERLAKFMTEEPELYLLGHRVGIFDSFFYNENPQ